MTHGAKWVFGLVIGIFAIISLPFVALPVWDRYNGPKAQSAVAAAAQRLARGEIVAELHIRDSVDRSELSRAFASGFKVERYDAIGIALNGYEVPVSVSNDDRYIFDAYKRGGQWHLDCCNHWSSPKPAGESLTLRPNQTMQPTADRLTTSLLDD